MDVLWHWRCYVAFPNSSVTKYFQIFEFIAKTLKLMHPWLSENYHILDPASAHPVYARTLSWTGLVQANWHYLFLIFHPSKK